MMCNQGKDSALTFSGIYLVKCLYPSLLHANMHAHVIMCPHEEKGVAREDI